MISLRHNATEYYASVAQVIRIAISCEACEQAVVKSWIKGLQFVF